MTIVVRIQMTPGWEASFDGDLRRLENRIAEAVGDDARRFVPIDSASLQRSIRVRGNRVYVGTAYWAAQEYGARPHVIYPRTKRALYWPGAAHPVARVRHPGNRPQPFMRPAIQQRRDLGRLL